MDKKTVRIWYAEHIWSKERLNFMSLKRLCEYLELSESTVRNKMSRHRVSRAVVNGWKISDADVII